MLTAEEVAKRLAQEIEPGTRVQLGAGLPEVYTSALPAGTEVVSEGGDLALVTAAQVSHTGDLAGSQGGAPGAKTVIAVMSHCTDDGAPRIVERCTLPVSAEGAVHRILTDMALIDVRPEGLVLRELGPGISARDVQEKTDAPLLAASDMSLLKV